jgi:hypothetical protein
VYQGGRTGVLNVAKDVDKTFHRKGRKGLESGRGTAFWKKIKSFGKVLVLRMLDWGCVRRRRKGAANRTTERKKRPGKRAFEADEAGFRGL